MNRVKNTYFEKLLQPAASELLIEWFSEVLFGVFSAPYTVRMRENTDQKNSEYGHFSRSESFAKITEFHTNLLLSQWFYYVAQRNS